MWPRWLLPKCSSMCWVGHVNLLPRQYVRQIKLLYLFALTTVYHIDTDCSTALKAEPVCADNTWGLYNSYDKFFCCEADQNGDTSFNCDSNLTPLVSSVAAILVRTPVLCSSSASKVLTYVKGDSGQHICNYWNHFDGFQYFRLH